MLKDLDAKKPKIGVGVVISSNGKILLGKRIGANGGGYWACPGGHLEFGETPEECAKRELFEEVGVIANSIVRGPWINDMCLPDSHYITLFVFVNDFTGTIQNCEPHKCEGWHWFEWDHLPTPLFPVVANLIDVEGLSLLKNQTTITPLVCQ